MQPVAAGAGYESLAYRFDAAGFMCAELGG